MINMNEYSYITGEYVEVNDLGELRKALQMFPDSVEFSIRIRLLKTIDEINDGRSTYSIQVVEQEDKF